MPTANTILVAHSRPDIVSGAELAIADIVDKGRDGLRYVMLTPGEGVLANHYRSKGYAVWAQKLETRRRLYPGLHIVQSIYFARKFRQRNIDAVLCNTFAAASRVKTACSMARIPYAIFVREYISKKRSHRAMLASADMVLAVSKDVRDYLRDVVEPAKVVVAYDHLNAEPLLRRVKTHGNNRKRVVPFDPKHPVVGIVGRITVYKRQDLFLRSIPYVLSEMPDARFVVVGSASKGERDFEQSLKTLARQLDIEEKVVFIGYRPDAVEVMSELSVCCLTSDREPFPRTVLEAQLLACPVVTSNTGGCVEMVEDGVTGLLFEVASDNAPQQLATQVVRLLRDKNLAARCTEQARYRLMKEFASITPVKQLEEYLKVLVEKGAWAKNGRD